MHQFQDKASSILRKHPKIPGGGGCFLKAYHEIDYYRKLKRDLYEAHISPPLKFAGSLYQGALNINKGRRGSA